MLQKAKKKKSHCIKSALLYDFPSQLFVKAQNDSECLCKIRLTLLCIHEMHKMQCNMVKYPQQWQPKL